MKLVFGTFSLTFLALFPIVPNSSVDLGLRGYFFCRRIRAL